MNHLESILFDKIIVLLKVLPLVTMIFVIPGYFLRSIISRLSGVQIKGALALDFSLGYFLLLIPGLIAYFLLLSWGSFYFIWFGCLLILTIGFIYINRKNFSYKSPSFKIERDPFSLILYALALFVLAVVVIVLFLRGGHFIGDHQHHLAYIIKLLYKDIITPFVPMYEGATEIPYSYAYNINYLFSTILVKLSRVDLNLYWDVSPALYFILSFSAYLYLFKRMIPEKKVIYLAFSFLFVFYELNNWGPALDAEFMPIPDQFSRTIFLPVFFALFLDAVRTSGTKRKDLLYIPVFGLLASILFTHVYSYGVIILVAGFYTAVDFVFSKDYIQKAGTVRLYVSLMFFSLFMFFVRSWKTDFSLFLKIEKYYTFILAAIAAAIVIVLVSRKLIEKIAFWSTKAIIRKILSPGFCFILLAAFWKGNQEHVRYMNFAEIGTKYGNFLRFFEFSFFQTIGVIASFILFVLSFSFYRISKNGNKEIVFSSNPAKAKKWSYVDQKAIFLLISISLVLIFTAMPLYNVKLSKLISEVYSRRMVSFQETYFIYWIALVLAVFSGRILKISRLYSAILILFLIILSVNITLRLKDRLYDNTWNRDYILLQEDNVFDYIRENIEPWSVIASYKYVAMDVVAQTPNYFISSNTVHMPYIQDYRDRKKATSIILSFKEPIEIILDSCQKYNVSFILTEYNNYDSFAPVYDLIKFNDAVSVYPELFHIVFSDERYVLYKVRI